MNNGENSRYRNGADIGPFRLADWYVEPALKRLSRGEETVQVEPRIMHVLTCLARRPGEVVSRSGLLEAVWGDVIVNEEALTHAISQLRRVFGDDAKAPQFIQTIHKTGYRLIAPVAPGAPLVAESRKNREQEARRADGVEPHRGLSRRKLYAVLGAVAVVAVVISVLSVLSRTTSSVAPPPIALDAIPFTTYAGNEECPAISPDGTRIAFSWYTEDRGDYDLYVKQRNTEKPLRLTETEAHEFYAAWSPDGADLAYASLTTDGAAIFTIPAIGGVPWKVVDLPFGVAGIDWSPDGRYLAYSTRRVYCGPMRIYVHSMETGESEQVTTPFWSSQGDFRPAFSPDGKKIAFIRGDRTWLQDIFVVPAGGGEAERLTSSQHHISGLDWMPDGESLVFSAGPSRPGDLRLWRLSLKDGSLTWLPTPSHRAARPSIALTGGKMVFEDQDCNSDIQRVTIGDGEQECVTIVASTRHDYGPQYSPGGKYISFISNRSGSPQIWISDCDGGGLRQLTRFENAYIENPCWSHDERRVAFTAAPGSYTAIYVGDVDTGEVRRLSTSDRHEMCLGWSRDGEWLYCKSERDEAWWVYKMRIDGDEVVDIMEKDVFRLAETSDGECLMYSRADTSGVWYVSIEGTGETCLVNEPGVVVPCGWREDAEGVYFFNHYEGDICMWFRDAETGQSRVLTTEADFNSTNIDVAPHGKAVIYDRMEHNGSDLSLVENFR